MMRRLANTNPPSSTPTLAPSSGSASRDGSASFPTDKCLFSATTACPQFRTCSNCLQTMGCRISANGYCERDDPETSSWYRDYRAAIDQNLVVLNATGRANASDLVSLQSWMFSASNATYCPSSDAICQQCTQQNFWRPESLSADSRFCVGANGCVCVANCALYEKPTMCAAATTAGDAGDATTPVSDGGDEHWKWLEVLGTIATIGALVFIASVVKKCRARRERSAPAARDTSAFQRIASPSSSAPPHPQPSAPSLELQQGPEPSAPALDLPQGPQPSAPTLELQPMQPQPSEPTRRGTQSEDAPSQRPAAQLELYGWISHRQHLIDEETRRLNGADDFVPARDHLQYC